MSETVVQQLEEEIEREKQQLVAKQLLLKAVKRQARKPKLFHETGVGQTCAKSLVFLTSGTRRINESMCLMLQQPRRYKSQVLRKKTEKLVVKAKDVRSSEDKHAHKYSIQATKLLDMIEENGTAEDEKAREQLREIVERLKSDLRRKAQQNVETLMTEELDKG